MGYVGKGQGCLTRETHAFLNLSATPLSFLISERWAEVYSTKEGGERGWEVRYELGGKRMIPPCLMVDGYKVRSSCMCATASTDLLMVYEDQNI